MTATVNDVNKLLFDRVATGDEVAFNELFYQYARELHPFLLNKLRSAGEAEELLQDIFLKVWVYRERFSGLASPEGYLFRIASNRVKDHFREESKKILLHNHLQTTEEIVTGDPAEPMELREAKFALYEGVSRLSCQRRRIYELKQEGLRNKEIADLLKTSPHTVRNQLASANRFLLEFLRRRGLGVFLLILNWKFPVI